MTKARGQITITDVQDGKSVTITSISVTYATTTDNTQPTEFPYTSVPTVKKGMYLWSKTTVNYSDGKHTDTYAVSRIGYDGDNGASVHVAYSTAYPVTEKSFTKVYKEGVKYVGIYSDFDTTNLVGISSGVMLTDDGQLLTYPDPSDGEWNDPRWVWQRIAGEDGVSSLSFTTNYSYAQPKVDQYGKAGYQGVWSVNESTAKAKAGDSVMLRITNSTKGRYEWIVGLVISVPSDKSVEVQTTGLLASGADGKDGNSVGRNLLYNAGFDSLKDKKNNDNSGYHFVAPYSISGKKDGVNILSLNLGTGDPAIHWYVHGVEGGQTYTFSAWMRKTTTSATNNCGIQMDAINVNNERGDRISQDLLNDEYNDWTFFKKTFTLAENTSYPFIEISFWRGGDTSLTNVEICQPKLELGTEPTAFCLNEADLKGADGAPSETYYINPSALIVTERLNTANDNTDKEKKYTDKDFVYDIPSTFSIHHSVGDSDSIIKIDDDGWNCSEGAALLPIGWNMTLQDSFAEGKGYDLTSILTKSGLTKDSSVLKIVLVAKVSNSVSLNIEVYINRLGTTQMETYGDTTTIVREKVLADVKKGYVDVDTYNNYTKATSEQFGNYYTKTQMDGQTGDIKKSISSVEQTAESISLMVTSQRSGRNQWINGDFEMNPDLAPKYSYNLGDEGGSQGINNVALPAGFNKQLVFKCSKAFQGIYYNGTQPNLNLTKGTTYCLSFFARVNMEVTGKIYFGMSGLTTTTEDITATWKRYCIYLTPDKDYAAKDVSIVFYPYAAITDANGNAGYICLTGIQLEVGSESTGAPTVWSKSTDDMKQTTGIDIQNGLINAIAGMFNFVGKNGKPYIKVEQDSNGYPHLVFYNPTKTDSAGNPMPAYDLGYSGLQQIIGTGRVTSWLHVNYQKTFAAGAVTNPMDFYREMLARGYRDACRYDGGYYLNPQFGKVWLPAEAEKYDGLYYDTESWDKDFLPTGELLADGWHLYQSGYKSGGVYDGVTAANQNKGHYYEYTYRMFYTKSGKRYTTEHTVSVRYTDSRLVAEGYEYGMYFDGDSANVVYYGTTGNTVVFPDAPTK